MRGCLPQSVHGRAIIGVIALYALCLQVFLGGLAPRPLDVSGSAICAEHGGTGAPTDDTLPCRQHACCAAMQAAELSGPAPILFAAVVWPTRKPVSSSWDGAALPGARAPPDQSVSPRGPPAS